MIAPARSIVRIFGVALLSTVLACHHAVRVRTAEAGADVNVTFAPPRTLTLVRPSGDTTSVARVGEVKGRVLASDGSRIDLRVASLTDANGSRISTPPGVHASIPNDGSVRIERSETSVALTALTALGICLGVFALGIALGGGGP